jgi:hypothetical protein
MMNKNEKYKLTPWQNRRDSTVCNQNREENVFIICQTLRKLFRGKFPMVFKKLRILQTVFIIKRLWDF